MNRFGSALEKSPLPDTRRRVAALTRLAALHCDLVAAQAARLDHLLLLSSRCFSPLDDPLTLHYGAHRWLSGQREEAYSDWFAWVLEQTTALPEIRDFLHMPPPPATVEIRREVQIAYDDGSGYGRLDLLIESSAGAVCVIEIKARRYVEAEILKHELYCASRSVPETAYRLFIAIGDEGVNLRGFNFVSWSDICLLLRKNVAGHLARLGATRSAMVLAFVGAVENNLLGLCAHQGATRPALVPTIAYLEKFLSMGHG